MRLGLVALLLIATVACGSEAESEAERIARENAERDAEYFCSMEPGIGSIYSDEFKNCVERRTEINLANQ